MPSWHQRKSSDPPSQIPTIAVPEKLDRVQKSMEAYQTMRSSRTQLREDSIQVNFEGSGTLGENDTPVVAEGSKIACSYSHSTNGKETPITLFPYHKEKADVDSTSGSRKPKSPKQLELKRERRRRAQQVRRLMKSDRQNKEPTPRVFMQWEKSEVQRLLSRQEHTFKSAHRAELQKQELTLKSAHREELQKQEFTLKSAHQEEHQKQELTLESAHRAELQKQEFTLKSAHREDLRKQELTLESAHQAQQAAILKMRDKENIEDLMSILSTCKRIAGHTSYYPDRADHAVRRALGILDELHDSILLDLKGLVKGGDLHTPTYEKLHCE